MRRSFALESPIKTTKVHNIPFLRRAGVYFGKKIYLILKKCYGTTKKSPKVFSKLEHDNNF